MPLFSELEELGTRYQRIAGSMTVRWEGEEIPLPRCSRTSRARTARCGSGRGGSARSPTSRSTTSSRPSSTGSTPCAQQAAQNAGFANYRDYIFPAKNRFDYTPDDCERFHAAVEQAVVPAVARR